MCHCQSHFFHRNNDVKTEQGDGEEVEFSNGQANTTKANAPRKTRKLGGLRFQTKENKGKEKSKAIIDWCILPNGHILLSIQKQGIGGRDFLITGHRSRTLTRITKMPSEKKNRPRHPPLLAFSIFELLGHMPHNNRAHSWGPARHSSHTQGETSTQRHKANNP